jgi:hypothetical protein
MARPRMRQLNLEVCSFSSNFFHSYDNILLPNYVIMLTNIGQDHEVLGERCEAKDTNKDIQVKGDA